MRKRLIVFLLFMSLAGTLMAQLTVTFGWDASTTTPVPENPTKYLFWTSASADLSNPVSIDVGPALEVTRTMPTGVTYHYVTAYRCAISDGTVCTGTVTSEKSNVLRVEVFAPPGRPDKLRIKTVVGQ